MSTTYTVVGGDNLWNIAERFYGQGPLYRIIAEANQISNPDLIFPGQVLQIPDLAPQPPPTDPPQPIEFRILRPDDLVNLRCTAVGFRLTASDAPAGGPVMYTVVAGDTLWDIARRFYGDPTRYPEIALANHIPDANLIVPGQLLTIPALPGPTVPVPGTVTYTVVSGDTLWAIAGRFYGDPRRYPEIARGNNIPNADLVFPGQVLVIPGLAPPDGNTPSAGTKYLVVESNNAFIAVRFGSQNLYEQHDPVSAEAAKVLAAWDSRVVFKAPVGTRIEFSAAGVLRALPTLPLRVSDSATAAGVMPPNELQIPAEQQTSIEAPFRLVVSPSGQGAFVHDADATTAPGDPARVELWSTRLAVRVEKDGAFVRAEEADDTQRIVRALHARDDDTPEPPFEGSLTGRWRKAIARLTSQPQTVEGKLAEPRPLTVRKLYLSGVGAWIDWTGAWNDAEIAGYRHLAPMGRDAYVEVEIPGFLFPFGHPATLVVVTERRIDPGPDPVARLFQNRFIVLREPSLVYAGNEFPFTKVTIAPRATPDLDQDGNTLTPFVPTVHGQNFSWSLTAQDQAQKLIRLTTPLVFVPDSNPNQRAAADLWAALQPIDAGGQEIAMAPERVAGDTAVRVHGLSFEGTIGNGTSTPALASADVSIPALAALQGGGGPVNVRYTQSYLGRGFGTDDKDPAQVFLELTNATKLDFSTGSDRGGGFIQPSMGIQGLSRIHGAISDKNATTQFDLHQLTTGGALPRLFGLFDLTEIIVGTGLAEAPKLVAEKLNLVQSLGSEQQRLLSALDATSADLARAIASAPPGVAALRELKARTDAARTALDGAANSLGDALDAALRGEPSQAAAQVPAFLGKLAQLDAIVSNPSLPAFARAALEKPLTALHTIASAAQDPALSTLLQAAAAGVVRFDWHPKIGPWPPAPHDPVFIPTPDGLTISVEIRATDGPGAGSPPRVDVSAQLAAFELALPPGHRLMSLRFSRMGFRVATGRKTEVDVVFEQLRFEGELEFIDKLRQVIPLDGFADPPHVDISPEGVTAGFGLALPSVAVGVFSLENIALSADCRVPFLGDSVTVGFGFCRKDAPFRLTVMAIGGGGWVAVRLNPQGLVVLEMGLEAGAALSIDLGVASGSVSVMIGVYLRLEGDEGQLTGYFRIRGEVDVLGLASASITLELSLTYDTASGKLVGRASLRLAVEVLFFSTSVEVSVERRLAGSKGDPKLIDVMPPDRGGEEMWRSYFQSFAR